MIMLVIGSMTRNECKASVLSVGTKHIIPDSLGPPKGTSVVSPETAAYVDPFKSIGITQAKAAEAATSKKSAALRASSSAPRLRDA